MFSKILPFVLFFILLSVISYFFFFEPSSNFFSDSEKEEPKNTCTPGETIDCETDLDCEGKKYCTSNGWTDCTVSKICIPGSKKKCMDGCLNGYEICNECGTAYSPCLGESSIE